MLDNGAFHKARRLLIPNNIALCFIPPYNPELNPAEKVWAFLKRKITNKAFKTLKELQNFMDRIIQQHLSMERIKSITHTTTYEKVINASLILQIRLKDKISDQFKWVIGVFLTLALMIIGLYLKK